MMTRNKEVRMMLKKRKWLAALLAAAMMLSGLQMSVVYAEGEGETAGYAEIQDGQPAGETAGENTEQSVEDDVWENTEEPAEDNVSETTQGNGENSTVVPEPTYALSDGYIQQGDRPVTGITVMDENGNVYETDGTAGVEEQVSAGNSAAGTKGRLNAGSRAAGAKLVNFNTKGAYTTEYKEVETGAAGYTCGAYGADAAFLGYNTVNGVEKVRFMLSGVIGEVNANEVQVVDITAAKSISHYVVTSGRLIHNVTTNITTSNYLTRLDNGPAPSYLQEGVNYYSYDGHYFYTYEKFASMLNDYSSGTRANSVNANQPFYNYFQFLPLRSQTNYTAEELNTLINSRVKSDSKMRDIGAILVEMQNTYGVNALAIAGVAANESAWGTSKIAMEKNNLFGLNAVDSAPEMASYYESVAKCIKDFSETYMSKRYLRAGYTYYKGGFLGAKSGGANVSYASDPYWGEKAANVMWNLDRSSGLRDYQKYTIGIKDVISGQHTKGLNVRNGSSTGAAVLYTVPNQTSIPFIILGEENGFFRIQSDPVLKQNRTAIDPSTGVYNFSQMYAYVSSNYVQIVHTGNGGETPAQPYVNLLYNTYVYGRGWGNISQDGETSGTVGQSKPVIGVALALSKQGYTGSIQFSGHVQNIGWQAWQTSDNGIVGADYGSNRLEAVKLNLTGDLAEQYDIYYRTHVQNFGWLGWAKNGEPSGSEGYGYRMEAIQIKLVAKGAAAPGSTSGAFQKAKTASISYSAHVQNIGWQKSVSNGVRIGTVGQSLRLEGIKINLVNPDYSGSIVYATHIQDIGWQKSVANGALSGTTGQSKRLEAISIALTGDMEKQYDIYYRVHIQNYGWLAWAKNGQLAGSEGMSLRMEAMEIKILPKGSSEAPSLAGTAFHKK